MGKLSDKIKTNLTNPSNTELLGNAALKALLDSKASSIHTHTSDQISGLSDLLAQASSAQMNTVVNGALSNQTFTGKNYSGQLVIITNADTVEFHDCNFAGCDIIIDGNIDLGNYLNNVRFIGCDFKYANFRWLNPRNANAGDSGGGDLLFDLCDFLGATGLAASPAGQYGISTMIEPTAYSIRWFDGMIYTYGGGTSWATIGGVGYPFATLATEAGGTAA